MDAQKLFVDKDVTGESAAEALPRDAASREGTAAARLRRPDRRQVMLEPVCLDDRVAADHAVRLVWSLVQRLNLKKFDETIKARGRHPGRASTDPRLLVALWLYASIDNVGSARRLERLCQEHDAYRWLCGGVKVNHHTLSDFRVGHAQALDDLLTQMIAALVAKDLVHVDRISQDSLRRPASAGRSSFRRAQRLEELLADAKAHVEQLKQRVHDEDDERSARQRSAQERAARERQERLEAALKLVPELEEIKSHRTGRPSRQQPVRVSTTDSESRRMRLGNGAIAPGYSVQLAADPVSRAIVGLEVVNVGNDQGQCQPLRQQVQERSGLPVKEHLLDGGFISKKFIEHAEQSGVAIFAPLPKSKDGQPCRHEPRDTPGVKAWRARMLTDQGQDIYKQRISTSETVNAELKEHRSLLAFNVRGLIKVKCVALWSALAYNIIHVGAHLLA